MEIEPWNDKEFMEWAFGGEGVSLCLEGYHKILYKFYQTFLHIKDGSIRERYIMYKQDKIINMQNGKTDGKNQMKIKFF